VKNIGPKKPPMILEKVRKLGGSIYAVVVMLASMDKTETNTIPVTTYGSFQDFSKTGER